MKLCFSPGAGSPSPLIALRAAPATANSGVVRAAEKLLPAMSEARSS
jgi:hypothetical protein